jgi:hypothetical protein
MCSLLDYLTDLMHQTLIAPSTLSTIAIGKSAP